MGHILEWIDAEELSENPEIKSRNLFANANHEMAASQIVQKYNHLTLEELRKFLAYVTSDLKLDFRGVGVDLGAGVGGVSNCLLSLFPAIEKIYAVEIVPEVVRKLQTKVTEHMQNDGRMISVIGSFDEIKVPDNSVDFIVEFDSLHHSMDLERTLREAVRILKPNGMLIALDRAHWNNITDAQREMMLDVEYQESFKKSYGIPLETKLTRRDNGEHEIRESEWREAFANAGLEVDSQILYHRKSFRGFAFAILAQLPYALRKRYNFYPMLVRFPLSFFAFYLLPFMSILWRKRFRELKLHFEERGAFMSKTVFVAVKR